MPGARRALLERDLEPGQVFRSGQPLPTVTTPSTGDGGFLSWLSETGTTKAQRTSVPSKVSDSLNGGPWHHIWLVTKKAQGRGTLLVPCDSGACCPSPGLSVHMEKERGGRKDNNGVQPKYPLISLL